MLRKLHGKCNTRMLELNIEQNEAEGEHGPHPGTNRTYNDFEHTAGTLLCVNDFTCVVCNF